jgi:two-component system, NtrC family, sensor kinase
LELSGRLIAQSHVPVEGLPFRILAIDDSPSYLTVLIKGLRGHGYGVVGVSSGAEGLTRLVNERFDCVLVDLAMPEMDGIEVCRRIRASPQTRENAGAVIILSASAIGPDLDRGFEAGADDFVSKSGELDVLRARIQALMSRASLQEENRRITEELKSKDLETLHALAARQVAETRATMAEKLLLMTQDLQEAKRQLNETQAQLIQNEKLVWLGQLVAGIAHEINNPLAFVVNNLFIAENVLESVSPEMEQQLSELSLTKLGNARARMGEMKEGLDRVKELVSHLLTFSRLEEGEFKTVDVVEIIDAVLLLLKYKMNGRIRVEKHYVPARTLHCYAGRLHQVLMNLIANAVDAIAGEGKIIITTSHTPEIFLISIRDTGTGIDEGIRSKIFDPFFTTKPIGQGTGLGLAISYGIVEDHGGSIEVHSQERVGTEFVVKIPRDLELQRGK